MKKVKDIYASEITSDKVKEAYDFQLKNNMWTFYNERELEENIIANRYNCLLVVYSLFLMTFVNINGIFNKIVILSLGLLITIFISLTIYRAYIKLNIYLKILKDLNEYHVLPFVDLEVKAQKKIFNISVLSIIGIIIPLILITSYIIAIILISLNIWNIK